MERTYEIINKRFEQLSFEMQYLQKELIELKTKFQEQTDSISKNYVVVPARVMGSNEEGLSAPLPYSQFNALNLKMDVKPFYKWAAGALSLFQIVFGDKSTYYIQLNAELKHVKSNIEVVTFILFDACEGIFLAAKRDFEDGLVLKLESRYSGEIFGDFVTLAKQALVEGNHTVACVLACAALEDALKRYAKANELNVEGKTMDSVVNALKSKELVSGAQKGLLSAMPKIRNYAMHADWDKLTPQDAGSVIGFVEQFLLAHFN